MHDPIKDEFETLLADLPILAKVAFTARAVRRVEGLFIEPEQEDCTGGETLIREAISKAEQIAEGVDITFESASTTARAVAAVSRKVVDASSHVAKAAAGAAGTGAIVQGGNPESATHAMRAAANCARDVIKAAQNENCKNALLGDIKQLRESCSDNAGFSRDAARDFLTQDLWPQGEPAWLKPSDEGE